MNVDIPSVQMEGVNVYAKMPRILMVTGSFPPMPCGVGDYCSGLVLGLARAGATVGVLGGHTGGLQPLDQARAFLLPALHGWRSDSLRGFVSALRRFKPNIIHFQYPTQGYGRRWMPWFLPAYAALRGIRVVVTWHEYLTRRPLRHLVGALTSNAFVVVRPEFRERLSGSMSRMLAGREIAFIPGTSAIPKCTLNDDELIRIRARFTGPQRKLVTYFGFTYPAKGTHRLFDILDPERHHLLLIGRLESSDAYQRQVLDLAASPRWRGAISLTGFQPPEQVAALLAASDTVVLPFPAGGGIWNSSLHAAMLQGTYVVATAQERQGYDESMNVFFVRPEDEVTMRMAVDSHAGRRTSGMRGGGWDEVALAHLDLYQRVQRGT